MSKAPRIPGAKRRNMFADLHSDLANRTDMVGRGKSKGKLSKGLSYLGRVASPEYDLQGMIAAYGVEFVRTLVEEVNEGRVDCRQEVERWSAHKALYGNNFDAVRHDYFKPAKAGETVYSPALVPVSVYDEDMIGSELSDPLADVA